MIPGEALYFRNDLVLHGSAMVGANSGVRIALAVDCLTSPTSVKP
jgi:hypothetical protein